MHERMLAIVPKNKDDVEMASIELRSVVHMKHVPMMTRATMIATSTAMAKPELGIGSTMRGM